MKRLAVLLILLVLLPVSSAESFTVLNQVEGTATQIFCSDDYELLEVETSEQLLEERHSPGIGMSGTIFICYLEVLTGPANRSPDLFSFEQNGQDLRISVRNLEGGTVVTTQAMKDYTLSESKD